MDIQPLTLAVIEKFRDAGGYTDLEEKNLFKSIHKALNLVYQKNFYTTQQRLKDEERRGIFPDKDKYEKEYKAVEDLVFAYANKLAAVEKHEV